MYKIGECSEAMAYPNVISVASTNANDVKSGFSNYGRWVDVAALLASQGKTNVQIQSIIQTTSDPIPGTGTF